MSHLRSTSILDPKKRYLQIALNSALEDARNIIEHLPLSERILVEAGTPLIKRYGEEGIRRIREWYGQRILGQPLTPLIPSLRASPSLPLIFKLAMKEIQAKREKQADMQQASFTP